MPRSDSQTEVLELLAEPATHGADGPVTRIDTHASVVFLAGSSALKLKRAVTFPFLDYSTLEKRKKACETEIAVNKDNAPTIYRGVVPVTREDDGRLAIGGAGEPVEWLVRMRRFDETMTLDHVAESGPLDDSMVIALAETFAQAHARAPRMPAEPWIDDLEDYICQNKTAFLAEPDLYEPNRVRMLSAEAHAIHARIKPLLRQRGRMGFIRRCHGDGHLGNIVLIDGKPVLFDAIEFDDRVATGDVLYDLAFVLMDLWDRGHRRNANLLLNHYLLVTHKISDLEDMGALPFYLMMRAAIRSKVTAARLAHIEGDARRAARAEAVRHFEFGERYLEPATPVLIAIGGLSGTGKTTLAHAIAPDLGHPPGAIVLRSDEERKIMFGLDPTDALPPEAYSQQVSGEVYSRVAEKARAALAAGHSVIADSVFAHPAARDAIAAVARAASAEFRGYWLEAQPTTLFERVAGRHGDASDADVSVVKHQLGYRLGAISWTRIDAAGGPETTRDAVEEDLRALRAQPARVPNPARADIRAAHRDPEKNPE
ncbi:AAA family ATPase [Breoghania sp. L-A4]|uniref:bifunctional aminoglycoside phosphotransferase/ATP-binding protein n=1 Tax=Breoghania sp. L-A4 TaxID=2304600 RepID=UPI0020BDD512|nr:AAA family ATPase [Breoghania sp. L-A4]